MSEWYENTSVSKVVNPKKSVRIRNNTKYFVPETSTTHVEFLSSSSYEFRKIKMEGYENRLYWQFRYCEDNAGQTFFYTLTYNDKACPRYLGRNCFDYEDLRDLFTGGFRKQLLRKYGSTFKYFVGAELGDGKGQRGLFNNPHYHILFFVVSACDDRYPYVQISPEDFRHLVRLYWQGFDEDEDKKNGVFHSYKSAKYGISREGDNCGLVTDFRACVYCAKYCVKDVGLRKFESDVAKVLRFNLCSQYSGDELEQKVKEGLNYYRNRYTNKVRISQGVGDYALDFISDKLDPRIQIPSKDGLKFRPIGMYYYRKLFTDVYKDESGSNIRVLNELGIQYKLQKLSKRIDKLVSKTAGFLHLLNRDLFNKMVASDVNTDVTYSYDDFVRMFCQDHSEKILNRYAEFKLVYKDRYFFFDRDKYCLPDCYPPINLYSDYEGFLQPSFFTIDRSDFRLTDFLDKPNPSWLSYSSHPYFLPYMRLFAMFDLCSDYFFIQKDNEDERESEERARIRRFFTKHKLSKEYPNI